MHWYDRRKTLGCTSNESNDIFISHSVVFINLRLSLLASRTKEKIIHGASLLYVAHQLQLSELLQVSRQSLVDFSVKQCEGYKFNI